MTSRMKRLVYRFYLASDDTEPCGTRVGASFAWRCHTATRPGAIAFGVRLRMRGALHVADVQFGAVGATTSRPRNLDFSDDA